MSDVWLSTRRLLVLPENQQGMRQRYAVIVKRIDDATTIGWPALAHSWRCDLDALIAHMRSKGVPVPQVHLGRAGVQEMESA